IHRSVLRTEGPQAGRSTSPSGARLATASPPEGMEEEQGVRARTRWPLTLARGARRTPCSVAPTAARRLEGLSTSLAGYRRRTSPRPGSLASTLRRGSPRFHPQPSLGASPGALALGRSIRQPADAPDHGPRLLHCDATLQGASASSPGHQAYSRAGRRSHAAY